MELFHYKAMDRAGRVHRGRAAAANVAVLEQQLADLGLDLIGCRPGQRRFPWSPTARLGRRDLIDLCVQLEMLTTAGVPLLQGLRDLHESIAKPGYKAVLSRVIGRIEQGHTLSDALADWPHTFHPVFIHLVRAGEHSGQLPAVLRDLAGTLKWQDELGQRARKALLYPAFVALVVAAVLVFLLTYLVPQLVQFIVGMNAELPVQTRILLAASEFVRRFGPALVIAPMFIGLITRQARRRSASFALRVDAALLRGRFFGAVWRQWILVRFARVFALLYRAGVPVLDILPLCAGACGNLAVSRAIEEARDRVISGELISAAFAKTALFPGMAIRMLQVGETTGALDSALLNISDALDRDLKARIAIIETAAEPVLTVLLGLMLGWIVLAVLGPFYDLIGGLRL